MVETEFPIISFTGHSLPIRPMLPVSGWSHHRFSGSVGITSNTEHEGSVWKSIPGFAKVLMLVQTVVIFFLSFWLYQEYLNNSYFQSYVNGYLQGDSLTAIILISIGSFSTVAIVLFARLRRTRKELEGLVSASITGSGGSRHGQVLDARTEQHLIDMIRKSSPIRNSGPTTGGGMPTLRRKDSQSPQEYEGSSQ